ncbi:MAG TPA: hypothetical protein VF633_01915 [Brevundimonas sp.]|jgi:hypothetical protein
MRARLIRSAFASIVLVGGLSACHSDTHDVRPEEPVSSEGLVSDAGRNPEGITASDTEAAQAGTQAAEAIGVAETSTTRPEK